MVIADDSRMSSDAAIASGWKRYGSGDTVPWGFQSRYGVELNSRASGHWVLNGAMPWGSGRRSGGIGYGCGASGDGKGIVSRVSTIIHKVFYPS